MVSYSKINYIVQSSERQIITEKYNPKWSQPSQSDPIEKYKMG